MERNPIRGVAGWLKSVAPNRRTLKTDAVAGLPGAIGSVPDGMAASVLAGVSPIHGLYASFAGPVAGGLTASTKLMLITTTSAAALAAGSALENLSPEKRPGALFLLTIIAGAAMIAAGLLRLGRLTRFVSHSVMVGFLSGVSVNIIAGQIPDLTGAEADGSVAVQKAWDVVIHPSGIEAASVSPVSPRSPSSSCSAAPASPPSARCSRWRCRPSPWS
jgi:SulP family sulfate permease